MNYFITSGSGLVRIALRSEKVFCKTVLRPCSHKQRKYVCEDSNETLKYLTLLDMLDTSA